MASQFVFEAIGTHWQIDIYESIAPEKEAMLFALIMERIAAFDKTYSRFRTDSVVSEIAKKSGTYALPEDAQKLFTTYHDLYKLTDGYFTPFMGKVLSDAGYDATYSLEQKKQLEVPPQWEDVIEFQYPHLVVKTPVQFDFGAAGKGYLIDLVSEVIERHAVHSYCIDAGGDILHRNTENLRVGMEDPNNSGKVIGVVDLHNKSLCGSAGNRRKWKNFHHIINPKSLLSPMDISAVWVVADTTLLADALTTCLFFVQPQTLRSYADFEYVILKSDYSIEKSENFPGKVFLA